MTCLLCDGTQKICVAQVGSRQIVQEDCPECTPEYDPEEDERFEHADMQYDLAVEETL